MKDGLLPSQKLVFICFNESSSKVLKHFSYSLVKVLFVLEMFTFLPRLLVMYLNGLIKKAKVDFKIYDATGQRINTIHILSNISRHKANKKLEFGQLITSIIKNNFLEKLYRKYYEEANRRPFNKKLNWTCVWMNSLKCLFLLYV